MSVLKTVRGGNRMTAMDFGCDVERAQSHAERALDDEEALRCVEVTVREDKACCRSHENRDLAGDKQAHRDAECAESGSDRVRRMNAPAQGLIEPARRHQGDAVAHLERARDRIATARRRRECAIEVAGTARHCDYRAPTGYETGRSVREAAAFNREAAWSCVRASIHGVL